jgi:hypothetical protein
MRQFLIAVIAVVFVAITALSEKPQPIHGEGCVEPGVEAHCLVLTDLKSGNLYSLLIKGMQPEIGSGIEFTGLPHKGATACMQGSAIDVQTWTHKDSLKCRQPTPAKK